MKKDKLRKSLLNCKFEQMESTEDSRFSKVKIWVAHTGWNYNSTYFSKDMLSKMADESLGKIPIVAFLESDGTDKDFAGHEEAFVVENDDIKLKYLGVPYGFIPSNPEYAFETKEVDGEELEYLTVFGEVWNKFDGSELFENVKGQSMELLPENLDGIYTTELPENHEALDDGQEGWYVTSAVFDALCALGDNHEPAMKGSVIEKFTNRFTKENSFKEQFEEMFKEYSKGLDEGGEKVEKDKEKYELKFDEKISMLAEKLRGMGTFTDQWGDEWNKYIFVKADSENVYYWDASDDWKLYGAPYSITQEETMVDVENAFEAIDTIIPKSDAFEKDEEFEKGNFAKIVSDILTEKFNKVKDAEVEDLVAKHNVELEEREKNYTKDLEEKDNEIEKLSEFKSKVLRNQRTDYVNSVANLNDDERKMFIEDIDNYTMETLKDEIAKVIGKKSVKFTKDIQPTITDDFVEEEKTSKKEDDDFNRFVKKYSRKNEEE